MTAVTPDAAVDDARRDALVGRLFEALLGTLDLLSIQLGMELGLYPALRDDGPATPPELAARTGIDPRYAREWLEQQAVTGFLQIPVSPEHKRDNILRVMRLVLDAHHVFDFLHPDLETLSVTDPEIQMATQENHAEGIRLTAQFLNRWSSVLRVRDPEAAAAVVYHTMRRILDLIAHGQAPLEDQRILEEFADMLLAYLFGEAPPEAAPTETAAPE